MKRPSFNNFYHAGRAVPRMSALIPAEVMFKGKPKYHHYMLDGKIACNIWPGHPHNGDKKWYAVVGNATVVQANTLKGMKEGIDKAVARNFAHRAKEAEEIQEQQERRIKKSKRRITRKGE